MTKINNQTNWIVDVNDHQYDLDAFATLAQLRNAIRDNDERWTLDDDDDWGSYDAYVDYQSLRDAIASDNQRNDLGSLDDATLYDAYATNYRFNATKIDYRALVQSRNDQRSIKINY
jgi:hypothetical protein